jgi:hypothetical protein
MTITDDLARSVAEVVEQQVLEGSAADGQTRGLFAWSGTTSYTAATATPASNWSRYLNARAGHEAVWGVPADTVLMHPRRLAYIESGTLANLPWRAGIVTSAANPVDFGAGGTQDYVVLANMDDAFCLFTDGPVVRTVLDWSGNGLLTVRFAAHQFLSFEVVSPKAVSTITGHGLGTPTHS